MNRSAKTIFVKFIDNYEFIDFVVFFNQFLAIIINLVCVLIWN